MPWTFSFCIQMPTLLEEVSYFICWNEEYGKGLQASNLMPFFFDSQFRSRIHEETETSETFGDIQRQSALLATMIEY